MAYVRNETQSKLNDLWGRLISSTDLRLAMAQGRVRPNDENSFRRWCEQSNVTNEEEAVSAYHMIVNGDYGTPEQPPDQSPLSSRVRLPYVVHMLLQDHTLYGPSELEAGVKQWEKEIKKADRRKLVDKKGRTLKDLKNYAEFKEFQKDTRVKSTVWFYRQHLPAYQFQQLAEKYYDKRTDKELEEQKQSGQIDYKKVGIFSVSSQAELETWIAAHNAKDIPENVLELKQDYIKYRKAAQWDELTEKYKARRIPWRTRPEQRQQWLKNPLNAGLGLARTDDDLQVFLTEINRGKLEKDQITLTELKAMRNSHMEWHDPEITLNRQLAKEDVAIAEEKKVEAPVLETVAAPVTAPSGHVQEEGPSSFTFPTASRFSNRRTGETDEETERERTEYERATSATRYERTVIPTPVFFSQADQYDDEVGDDERKRPSISLRDKIRLFRWLRAGGLSSLFGGGTSAAAGGVGATGALGGGGTLLATGGGGAAAGTAPIWGAVAIGVAIIVVLLIILFVIFFGGDTANIGKNLLSFSKSGPPESPNGQEIAYRISASYGSATDIVVTDKLPENTEIIGDKTTQPYTFDPNTRIIRWSVRDIQGRTASASGSTRTVDYQKYTKPPYNLLQPNGESDVQYTTEMLAKLNDLGKRVANHQSYILSKVRQDPLLSDPFLSVIWSGAIEGSYGNNYSWNCRDIDKIINNGCVGGFSSGNWQVAYGIQVSQAVSHLEDDFNEVYGAGSANNPGKVRESGQRVIDLSKTESITITNPSSFPLESLPSLISKARSGDTASQQAIAILLMDPEVAAVSVAIEIAGDIAAANDWAGTMQRWSEYYGSNMQRFSNRMKYLADNYSGTSNSLSASITLTLRPLQENVYIINMATGTVIGGSGTATIASGSSSAPNNDTCGGKYSLTNMIRMNFGDPNCNFTPDNLANNLRAQDPANAERWYQIARCESGHNPNAWRNPNIEPRTPDPQGAWGLFQMGSSNAGPGTPGVGRNGEFDRGDVDWPEQVKNATMYNKTVLQPRGLDIGAYWECARH